MELVVPKSAIGQTIHRGHVDGPAEGAGLSEPHVIDEHDEHVWSPCRRLDLELWGWHGVPDVEHGAMRILRFRDG